MQGLDLPGRRHQQEKVCLLSPSSLRVEALIGKRASWKRNCLRLYCLSIVQLQLQGVELGGSCLKERNRRLVQSAIQHLGPLEQVRNWPYSYMDPKWTWTWAVNSPSVEWMNNQILQKRGWTNLIWVTVQKDPKGAECIPPTGLWQSILVHAVQICCMTETSPQKILEHRYIVQEQALHSPYLGAHCIAKCKKLIQLFEEVVLTSAIDMCSELLDESAAKKLNNPSFQWYNMEKGL